MIARTLHHFQSLFSLACFLQQALVVGLDVYAEPENEPAALLSLLL